MKYPEFIATVAKRSGLPRAEAEAVTRATLQTLGERITGVEARDLAGQLPKELQDDLGQTTEEAEPFGMDEFVRRVGKRAQAAPLDASDGVAAVFQTAEEAAGYGRFDDVMAQLPEEFGAFARPIMLPSLW
jgi:uncharacterized protein (DUF2267 family)